MKQKNNTVIKKASKPRNNFASLCKQINTVHQSLYHQSVKAINTNLTIRNYILGYCIVEFEQHGSDKAKYGTNLLQHLASKLQLKGLAAPELSRCRQFYLCYPSILGSLTQEFNYLIPTPILVPKKTARQELKNKKPILGSLTQEFKSDLKVPSNYYQTLITKISFTHFVELIKIKDEYKRTYYEMLTIQSTLSVRDLEHQIASLAYERIGLAKNKTKVAKAITKKLEPATASEAIKSIYLFDFLNISDTQLITEGKLEDALIANLQKFILELGNGFCFEARQKRILIDEEYLFIDLVFYHRILKCHVLIELKLDKFKHQYLSQLNSYVAYYNAEVKTKADNPTIGILLCTEKGQKMVEYAMAGISEKIFVSKYQLQLPSKKQLQDFIKTILKQIS